MGDSPVFPPSLTFSPISGPPPNTAILESGVGECLKATRGISELLGIISGVVSSQVETCQAMGASVFLG